MRLYKFSSFVRILILVLFFNSLSSFAVAKNYEINLNDYDIAESKIAMGLKKKDNFNINVEKKELKKEKTHVESELTRFQKFKYFMKGETAPNQLIGVMMSKHFSKHDYRENHKIVGLQYKGFWVTTFQNSHDRQVVAVCVARTLKEKMLKKNWKLNVGYKIGPMYGYREGAPDLDGFSILPIVTVGLSYKDVGISTNFVPGNVISWYGYVNFDFFKRFQRNKSEIKTL